MKKSKSPFVIDDIAGPPRSPSHHHHHHHHEKERWKGRDRSDVTTFQSDWGGQRVVTISAPLEETELESGLGMGMDEEEEEVKDPTGDGLASPGSRFDD